MLIQPHLEQLRSRSPASAEVVATDVAVLTPDGSGLIDAFHYQADDEDHERDGGAAPESACASVD